MVKFYSLLYTLSQHSFMRMGCLLRILILLAVLCKIGAKDMKELCLSSVSKKGCFDKASTGHGCQMAIAGFLESYVFGP